MMPACLSLPFFFSGHHLESNRHAIYSLFHCLFMWADLSIKYYSAHILRRDNKKERGGYFLFFIGMSRATIMNNTKKSSAHMPKKRINISAWSLSSPIHRLYCKFMIADEEREDGPQDWTFFSLFMSPSAGLVTTLYMLTSRKVTHEGKEGPTSSTSLFFILCHGWHHVIIKDKK